MTDFFRLCEGALALVPGLMATARDRKADTASARLVRAEKRLRTAKFTVMVCGEFKRGKSSLLNALLADVPPLFPVDTVVATSLVTVVRWGERERITVRNADGGEQEITRDEIADYVTESGNPGNHKGIGPVLSIVTPNDRLASGVVFVDTPGVGGVLAEHTAVTAGFLPSADVIVFVADFTQPLTASELEFLDQATDAANVRGDLDGLIFVVNKSDRVDEQQRAESLANTVAKLAEATGRPAESLAVVPVSSRARLRHLTTGDEQLLAESNFAELDRVLWSAVARRRARVVLGAALSELDATVQVLLDPLETELSAWEVTTARERADITAEVDSRRAHLDRLHGKRAEWRGELRTDMLRIGAELADAIESELTTAWHGLTTRYLRDPAYVEEPAQLLVKLGTGTAVVATSVTERLQEQAADIVRFFSRTHGLDLPAPEVAALPAPPVPDLDLAASLPAPERDGRSWERVRKGAEGLDMGDAIGGTGGGLLGGLIGTFLLPGLGTYAGVVLGSLIGGAVVGVFGAMGSVQKVSVEHRAADIAVRRQSIADELEVLRVTQCREMRNSLARVVGLLVEATTAELDDKIDRERESTSDTLNRLTEVVMATDQAAAKRRAELDRELAPLRRAREEVRELAVAAEAIGRAPEPTARE